MALAHASHCAYAHTLRWSDTYKKEQMTELVVSHLSETEDPIFSGPPCKKLNQLGLRVGGHLALSLHSSNEPGELSQ